MTDLSAESKALANYRPTHKVRFVTAASLFDGHDAAINIMRRILQGMGAEVIHLGHNRSGRRGGDRRACRKTCRALPSAPTRAAMWSIFKYMVDLLRARGGAHIQVFGGGGGVIVPQRDPTSCSAYGVARIYSPEDGQRMGLARHDRRDGRCAATSDLTRACTRSTGTPLQGHGECAGARWRS